MRRIQETGLAGLSVGDGESQVHCTLLIRLLDYDLILLVYFNSGLLTDYGGKEGCRPYI